MTTKTMQARGLDQKASAWLATTDGVFAVLSIGVAVIWVVWLSGAGAAGFSVIAAFLLLLTAIGFFLARQALKRDWTSKWFMQLIGPTMAIFILFGLLPAIVSAFTAALLVWFALRKGGTHKSAA